MSYGVTPAGFNRKPLLVLLDEIEDTARAAFGPGVIQSPQSPLGQLNGMYASLGSTLWETAESTYQSYDPDQAEGIRLEQLGRIRLLERILGESDPDYRQAITNTDRARIDLADIDRAAKNVDGVTYVKVWENASAITNADGMPPNSVAVAVLGGDDSAVAAAIRPYIVPGIEAYGNRRADILVDGYCRTVRFVRPTPIPLALALDVKAQPDRTGCPPPSASAVALAASNGLSGVNRPANGRDIDLHLIRSAVTATFPTIEVVSVQMNLAPDGPLTAPPYPISFFHIADIDASRINVTFV